ncbi:hypothetical protein HDU99_007181 [Rhizoclosmatium hyalinum]|nr:hypothetical protein HDU99_007181 [Rhizoclosmatium hyalinum]
MVKGSKLTFTFAVDHYGDQLPDLLVLSEYGGRLAMEERQFTSKAVIQNVTHTGSGEFTYIFTETDPTIYIGFCNKQPATRNTFTVETSTPTYNIKSLNISQNIHVSSIDDDPSARIPIGPDVTGLLFISNSTLDGMADWKNNGVQLRYEPGTDYIYVLFVAVWFMLIVWRFKQWFTNVKRNCVKWYQSRIRTDPDVEASRETVRVASHRLLVILTRVLGVIAYIGFFIVVPVLVMLGLQTLSLSKVDEHAVPFLVLMIPHLMYGAAPALLTLHTAMLALGMLQCVGIKLWGPGGLFLGNVRNERRVVEGEDGNAEEAARLLEGDFEASSANSAVDLEGLPPYQA